MNQAPGTQGGQCFSSPGNRFSLRRLGKSLKNLSFDSGQFASAYVMIQIFEEQMISAEEFREMAEAGDATEALGHVSGSSLHERLEGGAPGRYEEAIARETAALLGFLETFSPDRDLASFLRLHYDFHALKLLVKLKSGWLPGDELGTMTSPLSFLTEERITELASMEDFEGVGKAVGRYASVFETLSSLEKSGSGLLSEQMVDTLLDHLMLGTQQAASRSLSSVMLKEVVRLRIDFGNIRLLVRALALKRAEAEVCSLFLPGGRLGKDEFLELYKEHGGSKREEEHEELFTYLEEIMKKEYKYTFPLGNISQEAKLEAGIAEGFSELRSTRSLSSLEKLFDDLIIWKAKEAKSRHFTLDPIVGYTLGKLGELGNFRIVMTGKTNNLEPARIISLLRESYKE